MSSRQAGRSCPARLRCGASLPTCRAGDRGFETAWMPKPDPRMQGFSLESGAGSSAGPARAAAPSSWPCRLLSPSAWCWRPSLASAAATATATALAQPHRSRQRRARGRARAACAGAGARTWRCSRCELNVEVFSLTAWDKRLGCTFLCWEPPAAARCSLPPQRRGPGPDAQLLLIHRPPLAHQLQHLPRLGLRRQLGQAL